MWKFCAYYFYIVDYISEIKNVKYRQAVTKLRISANRLPVETGRYSNIPHDERLCKYCNLNEVGNEEHNLMQCNHARFSGLRAEFTFRLYQANNSFRFFNNNELFMYIVTMKDKSISSLVAKYCFDVLQTFDQL